MRIFILIFTILISSCAQKPKISSDLTRENLIPYPVSIKSTNSIFDLRSENKIYIVKKNKELKLLAEYLSAELSQSTGLSFKVVEGNQKSVKNGIQLSVNPIDSLDHKEAYHLSITSNLLDLRGNSAEAIFRGIQTISQLIPASSIADSIALKKFYLPTGTITDFPRYNYRGSMLDVARHFFGVEDVKRYIDHISMYKMNMLHLHLTDDQGWRIEIKSWPNLTKHGGSTQVGGGKGGFYTQEQFKEIVAYAASRYITIIPEIDMPGHTNAALASYPELNCNKKVTKLYTGTKVGFSSFCIDNEITYKFINDVIGEIAAISPGPYLHIGGDESHATTHDDYVSFIERVLGIVEKNNKISIGWDEIANTPIKPNTIVQYWNKAENTQLAVKKGARVIMSPASVAYLDMKYTPETKIGLDWMGHIEVDKAYNWKPDTIPTVTDKFIFGVEAPLWTETVETMDDIEYLTFPRLIGIAEIGWSKEQYLNLEFYKKRLGHHAKRLKSKQINYYRSPVVPWIDE